MNNKNITRLQYICTIFKNDLDIRKNYIEYISLLLYLRYVHIFNEKVNIYFEEIYKYRNDDFIIRLLDDKIEELQSNLENRKLFSNIRFKDIYIDSKKLKKIGVIIENIYLLDNDKLMIQEAYQYILEDIIKKDDIIKEKWEFYTPLCITNLISNLIVSNDSYIFDPHCGSGNLLISACKNIENKVVGIEKDTSIYNICMTNMLLHNIDNTEIMTERYKIDTNIEYDIILSNPPFSQKNWLNEFNENDLSYIYKYGLRETAVADYAYVLSMLNQLGKEGKMAVILPLGVLFRENEKAVRINLVEKNHIDAIIGLPENLFYSNRIAVIILIISNCKKDDKVLFIDASKEYISYRKNNVLTEEIQDKIVNIYNNRDEKIIENESCFYLASKKEIEDNDFNLSINRYIRTNSYNRKSVNKEEILSDIKKLEAKKLSLECRIKDILESL